MYGSMASTEEAVETPLSKSPNIGGIVFLGAKWRIATDDLIFPAFVELCVRLIGLALVLGLYFFEYTELYVQHYTIDDFLVGYWVICIIICINVSLLAMNSMQGVIWDESPRSRAFVIPLMYVNLVLVVGEVIWLSYGTHLINRAWTNMDNVPESDKVVNLLNLTLAVVIVSWIGNFSKVSLVIIFFKKLKHGKSFTSFIHHHFRDISTFQIIGKSLSFFFHDADFVPTDTAAALFLLDLYRKKFFPTEAVTTNSQVLRGFSDIQHYMKYSSSIYGFYHLPLIKKMKSFFKVWWKGSCFCCFDESKEVDFIGPFLSRWNLMAVTEELSFLTLDSFIFVNFTNKVGFTPYMIIVDKEKKKIVITIRGSMSLEDALTDLMMVATPIDGYENYYTHTGMMDAARNIYNELREKEILDKTLVMNPGYDIVVTGHSLGAGVAVVLSFLLRVLYKSTRCFAYACPICLNETARVESEEFVTTIVHGDDIFPRLTPTNFALMVNQMRHVLRHSKVPKYKIIGLRMSSCLLPQIVSLEDTLLHESSNNEELLPRKMLINKYNKKHSTVLDLSLYVPGKIIYFSKDHDDYVARDVPYHYFSEILISPKMTIDHLPISIITAFETFQRQNETQCV